MGAEALPLSLRLGPRPENTEENASSLKGNFIRKREDSQLNKLLMQ